MPRGPLTVVISAGQSRNPEKRALEQAVADAASQLDDVHVLCLPHLYDLSPSGQSFSTLKEVTGDLVVISWLYDRAAHWILDSNGVRGQIGPVELKSDFDEDEDVEEEAPAEARVIDDQPRPSRHIYCLDFRVSQDPAEFQQELQRISRLGADTESTTGSSSEANSTDVPRAVELLQRFVEPTNDTFVGSQPSGEVAETPTSTLLGTSSVASIDEHPGRRWYPVIDFSRCTNCMECIDFCLFGVYGIDSLETIMVEQADNCRKGCPACSRVCPQNAIIFPQHKTPAIAGAPVDTGGLKIDLSKLFGAPENDEDALAAAARERDEQLILAGREAVGTSAGISERLMASQEKKPNDELDHLLDELDSLDL